MMFSKEFNEKVQMFKDASFFKHTPVTPNLSNDYTWKVLDSGYPVKKAYYDSKVMDKIVCENHERYRFDAYLDLGTRNHFPQMDALGGGSYTLNEETGGINVTDAPTMTADDYDAFAENPMKWLNILFQRKFPDLTTDQFVKATMAFLQASGFQKNIEEKFANKYNTPTMVSTSTNVSSPFEAFHSSFRGIAGISLDMRRCPDKLDNAIQAYWKGVSLGSLQRAVGNHEHSYISDVYIGLIAHAIMNGKQFDRFYWPYLKEIFDACTNTGSMAYIYVESTVARFADHFADIPVGNAMMHLELDDLFEMRKLLPKMPLVGGLTTDMLGTADPDTCVDCAKKLIDEMGDGYVISQNKMLSFRNDCRRENLIAVNDFVRNYVH
ncbi:MAG: hypothetical protein IJJ48_02365 [Firmicutes bacterium]|nr:hypothetical protein [Bacillota bacterium]